MCVPHGPSSAHRLPALCSHVSVKLAPAPAASNVPLGVAPEDQQGRLVVVLQSR